jgi:hypothetical protein
MAEQLDSSRILQIGSGFWPSKVLLSAVELELFTRLAKGATISASLAQDLGLAPRAVPDFPDALVALGLLERDGEGNEALYRNTRETAAFLDKASPSYIGGILEMMNARLYPFWGDLTEALRTGLPQNEVRRTGKSFFEGLYEDPARLEQFMQAMVGTSLGGFRALADAFDFSRYNTVCDVGGATGQLSVILAGRHPHLRCVTFDVPAVEPIAQRTIDAAGLTNRVTTASGNFFRDPLPEADIITMSLVVHDWNLERKMLLLEAAHKALRAGGALIVIENIIDDARRENAFGLLMSLNMIIELGDAFDFTGADLTRWCTQVGFQKVDIVPLAGPTSAGIAYK